MKKSLLIFCLFNIVFQAHASSCKRTWFGTTFLKGSKSITSPDLIKNIDFNSCQTLSHEYAKDKNYVYFKPTPNLNNNVIILKDADSASFTLINDGSGSAQDKNHLYKFDKVIKKTNQIQ